MTENQAKAFAIAAHGAQQYGNRPYAFHLEAVVAVAKAYKLNENCIQAAWLHDTMEDCEVSFQDIERLCGTTVAEIVFCVTDELGRNRKERKAKTYPKIQANADATAVKLCDRIANLQHSISNENHRLLAMYLQEHSEFRSFLYKNDANENTAQLWARLEELVDAHRI